MKNVFFIQRAAIDVLLHNNATALDICTYLVISKYTDRHGYYSGVGYKTIKERLGVGQKKVDLAIKRLRSIEYEGQRLLYSFGEWMFKETGDFLAEKDNVGWVRGYFESEYVHHVWLSNDLVGCNGDRNRPLEYLTKSGDRDNHARLLLLMYKFCNRQILGVNYQFASITTKTVSSYNINNVTFHKSIMNGYHISRNIYNRLNNLPNKEICAILDDLRKTGFLNVTLSVISNHYGLNLTVNEPIGDQIDSNRKSTRNSFKLSLSHDSKESNNIFSIKLIKLLEERPFVRITPISFDGLTDFASNYSVPDCELIYRLDCKSTIKRKLKLDDCLATRIETIGSRCGLEAASRKGKFYKSYWWFDPEAEASDLVGILTPSFMPVAEPVANSKARAILDDLTNTDSLQKEKFIVPKV